MFGLGWLRHLISPRRKGEEAGTDRRSCPEDSPAELPVQVFVLSPPEPVSRLPISPASIPALTTTVRFDQPNDSPAPAAVSSSERAERPSSGRGTGRTPTPLAETLAERLRRVLAPRYDWLLPGPDSVLDWPGDLMPFQQEGVKALIGSERLLLADDMGLGKTLQVIVALRVLFLRGEIETALVVAPASVLDQWRQELLKWAPDLRAMIIRGAAADRAWQWASPVHVAIVGYETLRSDFSDNPRSPLGRKTWDVVVADEAQRIKNPNPTSQAVKGLHRRRSWALTGTPLENSEEELASIVEFVDHAGDGAAKAVRSGAGTAAAPPGVATAAQEIRRTARLAAQVGEQAVY